MLTVVQPTHAKRPVGYLGAGFRGAYYSAPVAVPVAWKTQAAAGRASGGQSVTGRPPNP